MNNILQYRLSIPKQGIHNFLVLFPFLLIYGGTIFQNTDLPITSLSKLAAFAYMVLYVIALGKVNKNLTIATLLFLPILVYGIFNSFGIKPGLSDGMRYMFPVATLFYGYSIRHKFGLLLKFVIAFVIINFLVQIVNYINWGRGIQQWFYYTTIDGYVYYNQTAGIIRATGIVVFFGFFGFFNMIAFFLINKFYQGKYKMWLLGITLFGLLASISYKALGAFIVVIFIYYYKKIYKIILFIFLIFLSIYIVSPLKINRFAQDIALRISLYITEGESARSESYRVMANEISNFNLFGRGVGVFGGPASTDYESTFYKGVGFNWYDTEWLSLSTTDTYLPHLFVELGIIGGLMYLMILLVPFLRKKITKNLLIVYVIYFCLFFDMLFSFSLNNLEYLFFSLVFVYPILHYTIKKDSAQNVHL